MMTIVVSGTNEGNIIEVLTTHNAEQRLEIAQTYETSYGRVSHRLGVTRLD